MSFVCIILIIRKDLLSYKKKTPMKWNEEEVQVE